MATDTVPIAERGVATLSEQAWERARCRAEIIGPLAQSETVGHEAAGLRPDPPCPARFGAGH